MDAQIATPRRTPGPRVRDRNPHSVFTLTTIEKDHRSQPRTQDRTGASLCQNFFSLTAKIFRQHYQPHFVPRLDRWERALESRGFRPTHDDYEGYRLPSGQLQVELEGACTPSPPSTGVAHQRAESTTVRPQVVQTSLLNSSVATGEHPQVLTIQWGWHEMATIAMNFMIAICLSLLVDVVVIHINLLSASRRTGKLPSPPAT